MQILNNFMLDINNLWHDKTTSRSNVTWIHWRRRLPLLFERLIDDFSGEFLLSFLQPSIRTLKMERRRVAAFIPNCESFHWRSYLTQQAVYHTTHTLSCSNVITSDTMHWNHWLSYTFIIINNWHAWHNI